MGCTFSESSWWSLATYKGRWLGKVSFSSLYISLVSNLKINVLMKMLTLVVYIEGMVEKKHNLHQCIGSSRTWYGNKNLKHTLSSTVSLNLLKLLQIHCLYLFLNPSLYPCFHSYFLLGMGSNDNELKLYPRVKSIAIWSE